MTMISFAGGTDDTVVEPCLDIFQAIQDASRTGPNELRQLEVVCGVLGAWCQVVPICGDRAMTLCGVTYLLLCARAKGIRL